MAIHPPLDRIDRHLIRLLQEDGRLSNKALAAAAGIAPSTCSERIARLADKGEFTGFHAEVRPDVMAVGLEALVAVRLRRHAEDEVDRFWAHIDQMPEVISVYHLSGANDFLCHVVVKDSNHLRQVAVSGFTALTEVAHIETSIIFEHRSKAGLPDLFQ